MLDVLIIGAGPTGLFMATELARLGMSCRIIDKAVAPSDRSKALAIQPRTLEIFQHVGILEPFLKEGLAVRAGHLIAQGREIAQLRFSELDSPFPFILSLEQNKTEEILAAVAASLCVNIERGVEFLHLKEDQTGVWVSCRHVESGREERIQARFVVGCDGSHSAVRKALQIPFSGEEFPSPLSLADVRLEWDRPSAEAFIFLDKEGVIGVIPMPGERRYRLIFQRRPLEPELTLERIQEKMGVRATVSDPCWIAHFQIHTRLAGLYQKGCTFLAGDAAHVHSPIGGQGMNSGLQDVFNLSWKLATRDPSIIKTYALERHAWGRKLLRGTLLATHLVTLQNRWLITIRNGALRSLLPLLRKRLISSVAQLTLRYPTSAITSSSGGMRAPNVPVGKSDLYTLMRGSKKPHLLLFGIGSSPLHPEAIHIPMDHPIAWKSYGIKKKGVCLIRPDLYIACCKRM